jgi:hypothetical protein
MFWENVSNQHSIFPLFLYRTAPPLGTKIAHLGVVVLIIITLHTKATNQDTLSSEVIVKQVGVVRSPHAAVGAVSPKAQAVS